jgi:hypothetical protein
LLLPTQPCFRYIVAVRHFVFYCFRGVYLSFGSVSCCFERCLVVLNVARCRRVRRVNLRYGYLLLPRFRLDVLRAVGSLVGWTFVRWTGQRGGFRFCMLPAACVPLDLGSARTRGCGRSAVLHTRPLLSRAADRLLLVSRLFSTAVGWFSPPLRLVLLLQHRLTPYLLRTLLLPFSAIFIYVAAYCLRLAFGRFLPSAFCFTGLFVVSNGGHYYVWRS